MLNGKIHGTAVPFVSQDGKHTQNTNIFHNLTASGDCGVLPRHRQRPLHRPPRRFRPCPTRPSRLDFFADHPPLRQPHRGRHARRTSCRSARMASACWEGRGARRRGADSAGAWHGRHADARAAAFCKVT